MSAKQREFLLAPRTGATNQAKLAAMTVTFHRQPKGRATCADCRRSQCTREGTAWVFVCTLRLMLTPETCPGFSDARKASFVGPMPV